MAISYERGTPERDQGRDLSVMRTGLASILRSHLRNNRGTSPTRKRPPPYDPSTTLCISLRWGPRGVRFLTSEVPLQWLPRDGCDSRTRD